MTGPDPAPLPPLPRLLAAAPLLAITATTGKLAARLCGCTSVEHLRASLGAWTDELATRRATRAEAVVRDALDRPRRGALPFAELRRDVFARLGPETRRVLHRHATRQIAEHPDAPIPDWINDHPASR